MLPPPGPPDPIQQILAMLAAQRGMGAPSPNPQMVPPGQVLGPPPMQPSTFRPPPQMGELPLAPPAAGLSRAAITALGQSVLNGARPPAMGVRRAKGTDVGGTSAHPSSPAPFRIGSDHGFLGDAPGSLPRGAIAAMGRAVQETHSGPGGRPHPMTAAERRAVASRVGTLRSRDPGFTPPNPLAALLATILGPGGGQPPFRVY